MGNQNSASESDQNRRVGKIMAWVAAIGVPSAVILAAQHTIYKQHVTDVQDIIAVLKKHFSDYEKKMNTEKAAMRKLIEIETKNNLNPTIETINKLLGKQDQSITNTGPLVKEIKNLSSLVEFASKQRSKLAKTIENLNRNADEFKEIISQRENELRLCKEEIEQLTRERNRAYDELEYCEQQLRISEERVGN